MNFFLKIALFLVLASCGSPSLSSAEEFPAVEASSVPELLQISPNIWTGGEPEGEEGFKLLKKLGVRTLINVDGSYPKIAEASRFNLRYVHIPLDYSDIDLNSLLSIFRVVSELEAPFYFHCYHGNHRGPTAAALAWRMHDGATAKQAEGVLLAAGTSRSYPGLWKSVSSWKPFPRTIALPPLTESAEIGDFQNIMAGVDRTWDNLKDFRERNWSSLVDHPDATATAEANFLHGAFSRLELLAKVDPLYALETQFLDYLASTSVQSGELYSYLVNGDLHSADAMMKSIQQSCKECHYIYRNE